jgi:PII-like signaling protein
MAHSIFLKISPSEQKKTKKEKENEKLLIELHSSGNNGDTILRQFIKDCGFGVDDVSDRPDNFTLYLPPIIVETARAVVKSTNTYALRGEKGTIFVKRRDPKKVRFQTIKALRTLCSNYQKK